MDTGFKDPIKIKKGTKKNPYWSFDCPSYDERSSCFVNAGTNYGVGHKTPTGHSGKVKSKVETLPFGRKKTEQSDYIYKGKPGLIESDEQE